VQGICISYARLRSHCSTFRTDVSPLPCASFCTLLPSAMCNGRAKLVSIDCDSKQRGDDAALSFLSIESDAVATLAYWKSSLAYLPPPQPLAVPKASLAGLPSPHLYFSVLSLHFDICRYACCMYGCMHFVCVCAFVCMSNLSPSLFPDEHTHLHLSSVDISSMLLHIWFISRGRGIRADIKYVHACTIYLNLESIYRERASKRARERCIRARKKKSTMTLQL
jgi:hypothetical protein